MGYNYGRAMCGCGKQAVTCLFRTTLPLDLVGTPACHQCYPGMEASGNWTQSITHKPTQYADPESVLPSIY